MYLFLVISLQAGAGCSPVKAIHHAQEPPVSQEHSQSAPSASPRSCPEGVRDPAHSWSLPFLPRPMRDCSQTPAVPQDMAPVFHHNNPFQECGAAASQHAAGPTQLCTRTSQTLTLLPPALYTLTKTLSARAMVFRSPSFFYGCVLSSQKQYEFYPLCWDSEILF